MTMVEAVRTELRRIHYSPRTEEARLIRAFIRFHKRRHSREMGVEEVTAFLNALVRDRVDRGPLGLISPLDR